MTAVRVVHWILIVLALLPLAVSITLAIRALRVQKAIVTVVSRSLHFTTGQRSLKGQGTVTRPAVDRKLQLQRHVSAETMTWKDSLWLNQAEAVSALTFLDHYRPNDSLEAEVDPHDASTLWVTPEEKRTKWGGPFGFLVMAALFGAFAVLAGRVSSDTPFSLARMGGTVFLAAGVILSLVGLYLCHRNWNIGRQWIPVEAHRETARIEELLETLPAGVTITPEARTLLGSGEVSYYEYEVDGRRWRDTSEPCQEPICRGRRNPGDPSEIKWSFDEDPAAGWTPPLVLAGMGLAFLLFGLVARRFGA